MASLEIMCEEYLRSTSPLAQRIGNDLDAAREAYQELWNSLNFQEQNQVLDEALIDPAAILKYSRSSPYLMSVEGSSSVWARQVVSHFSWFTKSQLDLLSPASGHCNETRQRATPSKKAELGPSGATPPRLAPPSPVVTVPTPSEEKAPPAERTNILNKIRNKVSNLKKQAPSTPEEKQLLVECKATVVSLVPTKTLVSKPKTPPPPPPSKQFVPMTEKKALLTLDDSDQGDDIPKTGFDFLDNW